MWILCTWYSWWTPSSNNRCICSPPDRSHFRWPCRWSAMPRSRSTPPTPTITSRNAWPWSPKYDFTALYASSSRVCHRAVRFSTPPCPTCALFDQARQDAPMLPRVLHLKEVALLLYRSIARGEPSWIRRPPEVRIRDTRSLASLLSPCSSLVIPPPLSLSCSVECIGCHRISPHWLPPLSSISLSSSRLFWQSKN